MTKKRKNKSKGFTYEEFKKEFQNISDKNQRQNKGILYELGAKMARESLGEYKKE